MVESIRAKNPLITRKSIKGLKQKSDDTKSKKSNETKKMESVAGDEVRDGKVLIKPADQLQLTEAELKVEHERILNAKNPYAPNNIVRFNFHQNEFQKDTHIDQFATHFQLRGHLIHKESHEAKCQLQSSGHEPPVSNWVILQRLLLKTSKKNTDGKASDAGSTKEAKKQIRNQFNFGERSAQTLNQQRRDLEIQTQPPPRENISVTVNQFVIYDAYKKELKRRAEVAAKDNKDKVKTAVPEQEPTRKDFAIECESQVRIMERIVNQNTHNDLADDFKFFEDQSDEFREGGEGTLLPLWRFSYQKAKKLSVTATQWSPKYDDLFACGYGSYDFSKQSCGMLILYTLKNPSFPAYIYELDVGVMCLDQHKQYSNMIAVGLYDGSIAVFNILSKSKTPLHRCSTNIKHTDPVWSVKWQYEEVEGAFEVCIISISSDGLIKRWRVVKSELECEDILTLEDLELETTETQTALGKVKACGTCIEFHPKHKNLFLVGSEEGKIYKCSTSYSSQYLSTYKAHQMGINALQWNPFHSEIFISCSDDWSCKIWTQNNSAPLFNFDLQSSVGDISWSTFSSSAFTAATAEGKILVYELNTNKYAPLCEQIIVQKKRTKLTHMDFNALHPIVVAGDSRGHCTILKLSPNLRKRPIRSKKDPRPAPVDPTLEYDKLQNLVNVVYRG